MATVAAAFRLHIPGNFEDAFLYMGNLYAVTPEREIVRHSYEGVVHRLMQKGELSLLSTPYLLRNDRLTREVADFVSEPSVHRAVTRVARERGNVIAPVVRWEGKEDFAAIVGSGDVLDMQIYRQRIYVGTTGGLVHADFESDGEWMFHQAVKRTDARCLAIKVQYGTLVASCGSDGILASPDDFGDIGAPQSGQLDVQGVSPSLRSGWLGYSLINYSVGAVAESFRAHYQQVPGGRVVISDFQPRQEIIKKETDDWAGVEFAFNDYTTFFTHSGSTFRLHRRNWAGGRLGRVASESQGSLPSPLSAHASRSGLVVETYDAVWLIREGRAPAKLLDGEALAVRTFPASIWYQNIALVVNDEGIWILSPAD